jgi:hypothetical protein
MIPQSRERFEWPFHASHHNLQPSIPPMALFQLDPQSIVARAQTSSDMIQPPTLAASVLRGMVGFTLVSVGGFAPWPIFERWFRSMGEMELYVACLAVFIGLSGICLHRLIIGPGSLVRFYKLFSLAFTAYAAVWVAVWVWLRGDAGVIGGLLGGAVAMGLVLAFAFDALRATIKVIAALFVLNAIGYYFGGRIAGKLAIDHRALGMLLWGVCFGVGLGAGLGLAFYFCQEGARAAISRLRRQLDGR